MAYMTEQIHIRIGEDRTIFNMIEQILNEFPDRYNNQSEVCRAAICRMHRQLMEEREQCKSQKLTTTTQTK